MKTIYTKLIPTHEVPKKTYKYIKFEAVVIMADEISLDMQSIGLCDRYEYRRDNSFTACRYVL